MTIYPRNVSAMRTPDYFAIGFLIVSMLWIVRRTFCTDSHGGRASMADPR
jgi:hypothetical protein